MPGRAGRPGGPAGYRLARREPWQRGARKLTGRLAAAPPGARGGQAWGGAGGLLWAEGGRGRPGRRCPSHGEVPSLAEEPILPWFSLLPCPPPPYPCPGPTPLCGTPHPRVQTCTQSPRALGEGPTLHPCGGILQVAPSFPPRPRPFLSQPVGTLWPRGNLRAIRQDRGRTSV